MSEPDRGGWVVIALSILLPIATGVGVGIVARQHADEERRRERQEIADELRIIRQDIDEISGRMQEADARLDRLEADVRTLRRDVDELQEIAAGS